MEPETFQQPFIRQSVVQSCVQRRARRQQTGNADRHWMQVGRLSNRMTKMLQEDGHMSRMQANPELSPRRRLEHGDASEASDHYLDFYVGYPHF